MLLKLYVSILALLFMPHTQVLSIKQSDQVLDVSVLIRAKQYTLDDETLKIKRGMAGCSGTYVSGDTVLTAAHCFSRPTTDIWVRDPHVRWGFRAQLVKLDPEHDLALLKVKTWQSIPTPSSQSRPGLVSKSSMSEARLFLSFWCQRASWPRSILRIRRSNLPTPSPQP
jgi:hypothetical protein